MGFGFSDDQEKFRTRIRDFVEQEIRPGVEEAAGPDTFSRALWKRVGESGLLGIGLPEKFGGQPGDDLMRGIVAEERGRNLSPQRREKLCELGSCGRRELDIRENRQGYGATRFDLFPDPTGSAGDGQVSFSTNGS